MAVLLLAVAAVAVAVVRGGGEPPAAVPPGDGPADGAPADGGSPGRPTPEPPAHSPDAGALLRWAERELPEGAALRGDGELIELLRSAGAPEHLVTGPGDPALDVVRGAVPRDVQVVARFGPLTVVDPAAAGATPAQRERRRTLATALLANPTVRTTEATTGVLGTGEVDMRLLSLLAALGARQGMAIGAFPGPGASPGVAAAPGELPPTAAPARAVLLTAVGGQAVGTGAPGTGALTTWLAAQLPPYAPDRVEVTPVGVLVGYAYASDPDGLVEATGR